jgi:hypothetical protein
MSERWRTKRAEPELEALAVTIVAPPHYAALASVASHVATPTRRILDVAMASAPKPPPTSRTLIMLGPGTSPRKGREQENPPAVNRRALERETRAPGSNGLPGLALARGVPERRVTPADALVVAEAGARATPAVARERLASRPQASGRASDSGRPKAARLPVGGMLVATAAFFAMAVALMTVGVVVFGKHEAHLITPITHASARPRSP